MADEKHLALAKMGVGIWNAWRFKNRDIIPSLNYTDLSGVNFSGFYLQEANFFSTRLTGANLSGAVLTRANLEHANLDQANLRDADLWMANFGGTKLSRTDLTNCIMGDSYLCNIDLSGVIGLETIRHGGPST